jgi:heme oxygenase (biliverdin-producing, ferredoxin)
LADQLSARLRRETQDLHRQAERAGIMPALLRGEVDAAGYAALLHNLHAIYSALEAGLVRHAAHPAIAPLNAGSLFRSAAIEADLHTLQGPQWRAAVAPLDSTQRYVQHLHELAVSLPALLAAHAYVRYLGDLSGGQILRRIVARALGLHGTAGTRMYHFGPPAQLAGRADELRVGLDAIASSEHEADALVAEARLAFSLHAQLFVELEAAR